MGAQCEKVGKYVMPIFRSCIAKELVNTHKLTQVEAAQKLGTTQAAISQYINSKRAIKDLGQFGDVLPKIQAMAGITAKQLANEETTWNIVSSDFCAVCTAFKVSKTDQTEDNYII
jgi:uncharacterized protein